VKVHQLIEALQKFDPNAEVICGSHTLKHPSCNNVVGVWPAFGLETGEFVHGGPLGDQNKWVKVIISDAWGCMVYMDGDQKIQHIVTVPLDKDAVSVVRGIAADPHNDPEWYTRHLSTCGTKFRGCDPECPKELAEQAMRP